MSSKDYFSGLRFLVWDDMPGCDQYIDRKWTSYSVLQFDDAGPLQYSFGNSASESLKQVEGAFAWVTYPGPRFRFGSPRGTNRNHRYVAFAGPRVQRYIKTGLIVTGPQPPIYQITWARRFAAEMEELFQCLGPRLRNRAELAFAPHNESGIPNYPRAVHLLEGLLLRMLESQAEEAGDTWSEVMSVLARRINEHPEEDWDFKAEAKDLRITVNYFRQVFSTRLGMPPGQYLQNARMELAAQMLRHTDQSITEIARAVRIDDIYYFNKLFKRHHHIPPGRYRRELTHRMRRAK